MDDLIKGTYSTRCQPALQKDFSELVLACLLPPQDAVIFQSAVSCRATHFLTGDLRHFGPIMNQPQKTFFVVVQTVADFLARLSHA